MAISTTRESPDVPMVRNEYLLSDSPKNPSHNSESGIELLEDHWAFVAASPAMREVRKQVEQVATVDAAVLLLGESGTGKEVIARLIHKVSNRSQRRFMKVNCAALPIELLESELFGYEAGAFTGARQAKAGKFETCHKGTILLDEIAEMPIPPQAKLLHVIQDGEFSRLGSPTSAKADVRILAATNVDVHEAVKSGRFRADLYYRLNAFTIQLPPLRERREDIPRLLEHFMNTWAEHYKRPRLPITGRMLDACQHYHWPGNVRELENFVKRYLILRDEDQALEQCAADSTNIGDHIGQISRSDSGECSDLKLLVRDLKGETERAAILHALARTNWCKQETASLLNISLRALHYKIRQYKITAVSQHDSSSGG